MYDACPGGALLFIFALSILVGVVASGKSMQSCVKLPMGAGVVVTAISAGMYCMVGVCRAPVDDGNNERYNMCDCFNIVFVSVFSLLFVVAAAGKLAISCNTIPTMAGAVAAAVSAGMHWKAGIGGALVDGGNDEVGCM